MTVYAVLVSTVLLLIAAGTRFRKSKPLDANNIPRIVIESFGLGFALVFLLLPAGWLSVSFAIHDGKVEDNLFPASDLGGVLIASLIGVIITAGWALKGYIELCLDGP